MPEKRIQCRDCGREFVFTEGEQAFYVSHNYDPPKRCLPCREQRKGSGVYGARKAGIDVKTREVLCTRCSSPASRQASQPTGKAICAKCSGKPEPTTREDRMTIEEWIEIVGPLV